jgi:hypothetical protein
MLFWYDSGWQVQSSFFWYCDGLCCIGATECGDYECCFLAQSSGCVVSVQRRLCVNDYKKS